MNSVYHVFIIFLYSFQFIYLNSTEPGSCPCSHALLQKVWPSAVLNLILPAVVGSVDLFWIAQSGPGAQEIPWLVVFVGFVEVGRNLYIYSHV